MSKLKSALTVGALVAAAGSAMVLGAGGASAQGTATPWAPGGVSEDQSAIGGLSFFDSSGNAITSGSTSAGPFAAYVQGRTQVRTAPKPDTKASLFLYLPVAGATLSPDSATPDTWTTFENIGSPTTYPNTAAPAPLNTSALPTNTGLSTDNSLDALVHDLGATSSATGYQNVYEVRMKTSGPSGQSTQYDYADITINSTAHTWALVYTPGAAVTSTTLTTSPVAPDTTTPVTLTATESPAVAGSVVFENGGTPIGNPVAVNGSGVATTTTTFTTAGTESLSAIFTPTDTTSSSPSTGTASLVVTNPVPHSATSLAVSGGNTTTGSDATLTATVTPSTATGSIAFTDNGTTITGLTPTSVSGDVFTYDDPAGFTSGSHSVVATFTSADPSTLASSQSSAVKFVTNPAAVGACATTPTNCTDVQNIQATVPAGTLIITTPYGDGVGTDAKPLDLGTMTLGVNTTSNTLQFSASATFADITVTDTRAGGLGWTVQAQSSDLTDGTHTINSQNVGLTGLVETAAAGDTAVVVTTDNPAANPAVGPTATGNLGLGNSPHTIAGTNPAAANGNGAGSYVFNGTMTLTAPASTPADLYAGTVTFTIS